MYLNTITTTYFSTINLRTEKREIIGNVGFFQLILN